MTGFSSTKGAIFGWFRTGATAAAIDEPRIWGVNTYATLASYSMICPITYYDDGYTAFLHVLDGTVQWNVRAPVVLATASGWQFVGLIHNGTAPRVWLNSATCTPTWVTSTDLTKWTKAVLTDASSKADCFSAGAVLYQGGIIGGAFKGDEDRITIYTNTVTDAQALTLFWRTATNHGYTAWQYANRSGLASSTVCKAAYNFNVSGVAEDTSGNGNHGTIAGATWQALGGTYPNGWLSFDGINDQVSIAGTVFTQWTNTFSVAFWLYCLGRPKDNGNGDAILFHSKPLGSSDVALFFNNQSTSVDQFGLGFSIDDTYSYTLTSVNADTTFWSNKWRHVVGIYNNSDDTIKIYIDGILNTNKTGITAVPAPTTANTFYIGSQGGANYFAARVDDLRLFANTALSLNEITNKTDGLYGSTTNWHLN